MKKYVDKFFYESRYDTPSRAQYASQISKLVLINKGDIIKDVKRKKNGKLIITSQRNTVRS